MTLAHGSINKTYWTILIVHRIDGMTAKSFITDIPRPPYPPPPTGATWNVSSRCMPPENQIEDLLAAIDWRRGTDISFATSSPTIASHHRRRIDPQPRPAVGLNTVSRAG